MPLPEHGKDLKETLRDGFKHVKEVAIQHGKQNSIRTERIFLEENILFFVTDGYFTFRYDHVSYSVTKQQYIFFRKDMLLEYKPGFESATFFLIILKNEWVIDFVKTVPWNFTTVNATQNVIMGNPGIQLFRYFELLQLYVLGDGSFPQNLAGIKGIELLYCLSKNEKSIIEQLLSRCPDHKSYLAEIIDKNISDTISLLRLAQMTGRSMSSFRRDFQSIYHMPPSRWIRQRKLEKAKELLVATNMTVTHICYTLGFESAAHFSRLFKSYFGYSPSGSRMQGAAVHT